MNGRAVVRWSTGYRALRTSSTLSLGDFDVFVAFRDTGVSAYERLVDHSYATGFWLGRDRTTAGSWRSGVGEGTSPFGRAVALPDGQWHVVESRRAGTTHTVRGNGGAGVSGTVSDAATDAQPIGIGGWPDGATLNALEGADIGEVVLVPAALGDEDRLRLEGYLAHRWGTAASLPADHPYRSAPPLTGNPATVPAAPTSVTISSTGGGQVAVAWTAPTSGGSPIRDYRIERRTSPSGTWTVVDDGVSTTTSTTVSGLVGGTTYEFRVAAVSAAGTGPWSAVVTGVPAVPWTPADLPTGLALWLDATDASTFTLDSGAVAEWRDRSGWSRHVSQTSAANRPTRVDGVVNGQSVVRWTTGYRALRTTGTVTFGDFDVYVAFRDSGASSYERLVDHGYVQGFWLGRDNANASSWRSGVQESGFPHGRAVPLADGQWHIVQSRRAGTTHTIRGDGATGVSATVSGATTAAQRIGIGAWADGSNHQFLTDGDIGEVVLVAAALGDDDRLRLEGYLAHKWGTAASLPAGHPYRTVAPATSTPSTAPAAPGGLTATPGTNQVTLAWTAPADGGTPIRDYRIEQRALPSGAWAVVDDGVGTATSTTVSGLTTGTTYEFRVAGVNAAGTGAAATASGAPTLLPPGAPTGVSAPAGDGQAVVSWTAPADNGSPVTSTTVTATASGQATRTCTASGAATTCTVTGLVNGATYTLSVAATNGAGTGPASTAATTSPRPAVLSSANGLGVWLDATDPDGDGVAEGSAEHCDTGVTCTSAGNVLTRWVDRSGLGNDAVQTTAAMAGRYVPGMDVAVNYDANGFNRVAAAPVSPDATTFVVAQSDTTNWNTLGWLMGGRAPGSILLHPNSGQGIIAYAIGATHAMIGAATPASITVPHLYEARVTGTGSVVGHFDVDGALVARDVALGGITRAAGTTTFTLGADDCCGLRYGDGRYREVVWFSRELTTAERRAVREYLAVKWGLTIAPDRP
ncbi:MAG: fibronectin type III domain-containing protein, partial [Acidimicrobiales bacterium]|nr:fibronectin type III domain-containing protein [Acidimicrobiales bacterium]